MTPASPLPEPLFPSLAGRRGEIGPQQVARHQQGRLQGAMVEAVARHGYATTTVGELVALAGVSKSTFYEHFGGKQECFLATFDEIVTQASERVGVAYRSETGFRERLRAAMEAFVEIVAEAPAATALVVVDSLSLGAAGVGPRERSVEAFELMFRQSFAQAPERGEVSQVTTRAIVAGIRRVVYRCLREGRPEKFRDHAEELLEWALAYQRPGVAPGSAATSIALSTPTKTSAKESQTDAPSWDEPPDSRRSRAELTQRERIVRAAALVATDNGYESLSIPAISAAAGTSNQTFYEHFASKEEAFIAAFDALAGQALRAGTAAAAARRGDWIESVGAGIRGLLEFIVANRLFAHLAIFQLPTAGADALDHADATARRFTSFLEPDALPDGLGAPVPAVVIEAIGGGVWAVIQHEIAHERVASLPQLAPQIARIVLAPLGAR